LERLDKIKTMSIEEQIKTIEELIQGVQELECSLQAGWLEVIKNGKKLLIVLRKKQIEDNIHNRK